MRAVRFVDPSGAVKVGRLDGEVVYDAGQAGPLGFVPSAEGWQQIAEASGLHIRPRRCGCCIPPCPSS